MTPPLRSLLLGTTLLIGGLASGQTTLFHYRVNDTDVADLPTIPSVGGSPGMAIGSTPFNIDTPTVGVPPGSGNRSLQGAGLAGGGVNSAGTQELLNETVIANGGFTYECWFKWFGGGTVNSIIDYAGTEKFRIPSGAGFPLDMNFDSGSGATVLEAAPTTNEWHYIAMVFEHDGNPALDGKINGTMTWYYDDTTVAAGTAEVIKDDFGDSLNRPIGVGRHPLGFGGDNFDGLVYEPRVTLGALAPTGLLFSLVPTSDPQLVAPSTVSEPSDGIPIQLTIPIENFVGTTQDLVLTAPGLSGPNMADFEVVGFDSPIAADGGTGNIVVDFTPSVGDGLYEATLTINSNDPVNPTYDVALSIDVRDPAIVIDETLDFGLFFAVPGPTAGVINVSNEGGLTNLTLSNPQLSGAGASAYTVDTVPASLPPLTANVIEITFDPGVGGAFPAQLTLETNDPRNTTVTVDLDAQVTDPEIFIDPILSFGSLPNTPGAQTGEILVENSGEGTDLVLSNPQVTGPAAAAYTVTSLPPPIPPNFGSDFIEVTFDPETGGGNFTAFLTLETNDPFAPTVTVLLASFVEGPIDLEGPSKASHWTFDDPGNLGDDSGGFDYDGVVNGDALPSTLAAVGSGALLLDGDSDYIEIPQGAISYSAMAADGEGFTIATWVCSSSVDTAFNRQRYFSKFFGTGGGGFGAGQNNDTQLIATTYGVADYLGATSPVQDEWHHVAYVFRGDPVGEVDYYMDGVFVATVVGASSGLQDGLGSYAIGGLGGGAGEWFDGLLDDLRVYAVELPATDIATLAAMGTPGAKPTDNEILVSSIGLTSPTRLRIDFVGEPDTLHEVMSSPDLEVTPFTGAVTPAVDGLTTDTTGAGFVEIDITVPGQLFYQIQQP